MPEFDPRTDYPIGERRPDLLRTPRGFSIDDLTMDNLRTGEIPDDEFRTSPATLRMQADVARVVDRGQLADNLDRAAELASIPDVVILDVYTALRPGRSTAAVLEKWAEALETGYGAPRTAALVREAAVAYAEKGLLE
ncbi:MAG: diol dehydratase small subunit [Acidimicrobiia bacterium]